LVCYTSIVFFYLVPDKTWVCQSRQWFLGMGGTLFLGALFVRIAQLHRLYRMSKAKSIAANTILSESALKKRGVLEFVFGIVPAAMVQSVILVVWSTKDTLTAQLKIVDDILRTARWVCKSDDVWLWIGLEMGFFSVMMLYGFYVAFASMDAKGRFPDARWLLMTIYNIFLTASALMPLFATIEVRDDNLFIMVSVGVLFVVSSTLLLAYIPRFADRFAKAFYRMRGGDSDSTNNSLKGSSRMGASSSSH